MTSDMSMCDKAPKQAAALAVMYEFMEDEVVKVAKRFVSRVAMNAINSESAKDEEAQALRLEVSNLTMRLHSVEAAMSESKVRERKAREELAATQEKHAQEVLELGQGGSKAMRDLLANFEAQTTHSQKVLSVLTFYVAYIIGR